MPEDTEYVELQRRLYSLMENAPSCIAHRHVRKDGKLAKEGECATLTFHAGVALVNPNRNPNSGRIVKRKYIDFSQIYNNAGIARGTIGGAEGVEKKEQVEFLADQECDMIQGFYFAKPMPANEFETYLHE